MACNLMARLFRRRRRQAPVAFTTPALPTSTVRLEDTIDIPLEIEFDKLTCQEDADFFYLGCLTQQGSFTLVLPGLPPTFDQASAIEKFRLIPGFASWYCASKDSNDQTDLVLVFNTAADAAMALATQPPVDVGNGVRSSLQYSQDEEDECSQPSRKRMKFEQAPVELPTCLICQDTIHGAYSTPCLTCRKVWCDVCLNGQFQSALGDQERFPARCCGRVIHHDVARDILSTPEYMLYKTRFEQHSTTAPIYCANHLCSAFLPPRVAPVDDKGTVTCPECQGKTCVECREIVEMDTHKCVAADAMAALLQQFNYKRCRRCRAGVAKMFGCSHVRCQCGAHWCWDCQRPVQMCWSRPCDRAQEDGDYGYGDGELDLASDYEDQEPTEDRQQTNEEPAADGQMPQVLVASEELAVATPGLDQNPAATLQDEISHSEQTQTPAVATEQANAETQSLQQEIQAPEPEIVSNPSLPVEAVINLDDEDLEDWQATSLYFGEEPVDESWDVWGCLHSFQPMHSGTVWKEHMHWTPTTSQITGEQEVTLKVVDCQKCYTAIKIMKTTDKEIQAGTGRHERVDSGCDIGRLEDRSLGTKDSDDAKTHKKKNMKSKKKQPDLFSCRKCGLCYCAGCKRKAMREMKDLAEQMTS